MIWEMETCHLSILYNFKVIKKAVYTTTRVWLEGKDTRVWLYPIHDGPDTATHRPKTGLYVSTRTVLYEITA